jgi:8-oxo-dGTP pyrophosphatase MutT (NUDIX family)
MFEKTISSAVLIVHNETVLACLPFGRNQFNKNIMDLPKGKVEVGEKFDEAAIREVYEETGIVLDKTKLEFFGVFEYKSRKDLAMFRYVSEDPIDISRLRCSTYFFDVGQGKEVPEHIGYEIVPFNKIDERFFANLAKAIRKIIP